MMKFYLILILIRLSFGAPFDPDIDICEDPKVDAAVFADDGNTYIFKGKYFWQTRTLENDNGIVGYAKPITTKWAAITDEITSIFTITDRYGHIMTVFVVHDKWFAYQKGVLKQSNSTNGWPQFPYLTKNVVAFSINNDIDKVFLIYDERQKYNLYDFRNFIKPLLLRTDRTTISANYIWFIEQNHFVGEAIISDLLKVDAVISYINSLIFIAKDFYCKVSLRRNRFEKECMPSNMTTKLLGCPLNLEKRPELVTVPHVVKTTTKLPNQTQRDTKITEEPISETLFGNSSEAMAIEQRKIKKRKSSALWVLIITGILILIVVAGIIVIAVLVNKGKRKKSSKLYIKNDRTEPKHEKMGKDGTLLVEDPSTGSLKQPSPKTFKLNSISTKTSAATSKK